MLKFRKGVIISYTICVLVWSFNLMMHAEDLQKFSVRNNDSVFAVISKGELSRFIFNGDKVKRVLSLGGELHYEILDENLYIKPNTQKPINFFVSTENGNTYKIIATPKDIPATQIFIVEGNKFQISKKFFTGESLYREKISKIIKVVNAEDETIGYKVKHIGKFYDCKNGLRDYFDSEWWGDGVIAEKHFLFNNSGKAIKVNKSNYLDGKIEAIYVDREVIQPGSAAILIKVMML